MMLSFKALPGACIQEISLYPIPNLQEVQILKSALCDLVG